MYAIRSYYELAGPLHGQGGLMLVFRRSKSQEFTHLCNDLPSGRGDRVSIIGHTARSMDISTGTMKSGIKPQLVTGLTKKRPMAGIVPMVPLAADLVGHLVLEHLV